jgi:hypothetical protein
VSALGLARPALQMRSGGGRSVEEGTLLASSPGGDAAPANETLAFAVCLHMARGEGQGGEASAPPHNVSAADARFMGAVHAVCAALVASAFAAWLVNGAWSPDAGGKKRLPVSAGLLLLTAVHVASVSDPTLCLSPAFAPHWAVVGLVAVTTVRAACLTAGVGSTRTLVVVFAHTATFALVAVACLRTPGTGFTALVAVGAAVLAAHAASRVARGATQAACEEAANAGHVVGLAGLATVFVAVAVSGGPPGLGLWRYRVVVLVASAVEVLAAGLACVLAESSDEDD